MPNFRPAGLSDDESGSDDDFYDRPFQKRQYYAPPQNSKKKMENTLQDAILNSNVNEVEDIITNDLNGNVNINLDSGWTPLMHACFHAQEKIVKLLLEKGADPNLGSDQVTAVMVACSNSSANNDTIDSIVNYLLEKDCLLNIGDKYGQTPLMRAISSGRVALVQKLLNMNVNIEMRDKQGWTAVFWAAHHNQSEILEMLIARGARLLEVDNSNRKVMEIAMSHDYQNIIELLNRHIEDEDEVVETYFEHTMSSWHDFYPGVTKSGKPSYNSEIPHLLYGMSCEKLGGIIQQSGIDLRTFLLLEENDLIKLGIDLPFQRQRLINGLNSFHKRAWKLKAVPGLAASKTDNFSTVDALTSLGSHLQQVYILEASLQYVVRDYCKSYKNEMKSKPPDAAMEAAAKMYAVIKKNKRQLKKMRLKLSKISSNNPQPVDLLKEKTFQEIAMGYMTEAIIVCSLGLIVYQAKTYFANMWTK